MNFAALYQSKITTASDAVSQIGAGSRIFSGGNPAALYAALFESRDKLHDLTLYSMFGLRGESTGYIYHKEMHGKLKFVCCVVGKNEAAQWGCPGLDQIGVHFSEFELIVHDVYPDFAFLQGTPMDREGFIYLGAMHGCARSAVDAGARVIVQIDPALPKVATDYYRVHISEVQSVVEAAGPPPQSLPDPVISRQDQSIAELIAERIPDGSTIQLGHGRIPNIVGLFLGEKKDLGIHTELFTSSMAKLMEQGAVNNSRKSVMPGVSIAALVDADRQTQDFAADNPLVYMKRLSWVNNPEIIRKISNMVSVNSCFGVDLRGQVCSESIGGVFLGGTGGQLDFAEGTRISPSGQDFIAMQASYRGASGEKKSKITLALPQGSIVSTPRTDVMMVVTEYGVANLRYKSVREQARSLIAIADPDFREQLEYDAKVNGLLV